MKLVNETGVAVKYKSQRKRRIITNTFAYIFLIALCLIWVLPIIGVFMTALRNEKGVATTFIPAKGFTFDNFARLFVDKNFTSMFPYLRWVGNTLLVALLSMLISTVFTISVAYTMSRLRFKSRKTLMSVNLILGMFPGFMSMIAVYNILSVLQLDGKLIALVIVYSASSGMGFYVAKGFFDTISKSLDEAAKIDGASNAKVFFKIIFQLSKPIIVYTMLLSFMGPWVDYIFSSIILGDQTQNYTIAVGLYQLISSIDREVEYFTTFFAGASLISIPIMTLFLLTQKYYVGGITGGAVKG